jgi:hypothetical protein
VLTSPALRGVLAFGVATTLALDTPALAAGGAATLGPPDPSRDGGSVQQLNYLDPPIFVNTIAPSGVRLVAPADGVITGWTVYTGQVSTVGATMRLRVLTLNGALNGAGGGSFTFTNSGPAEPVKVAPELTIPGIKNTFSNQHIPIKAGQYPGVSMMRGPEGSFLIRLPAVPGFRFAQLQQDGGFLDGQTRSLAGYGDQFMSYNVRFERDADHDRFGDTTQDKCPRYAGTFSGCATKMGSSKTVVKRGKKLRFTVLGATPRTKYKVWLGAGRVLVKGTVPKSGKVVRTVKIPSRAKAKQYYLVFSTAKPKERVGVRIAVRR